MDRSWEELHLPPAYSLERDLDMLILRRSDGSVVETFSARGAMPRGSLRSLPAPFAGVECVREHTLREVQVV